MNCCHTSSCGNPETYWRLVTEGENWQGGHILAKIKFPVFSLCYINFPCVIFTQKLTITSMNEDHITTVLLHTEAYKLIFKVWIV